MNKVVLVGRLTKDPELKKTNTDISYVQFTLAVNRLYQNKNGERQADFISCIAWRATAELLTKYIKKGAQIGIDGQIQTRTYDDQNGVRHYITEVVCDNVYFLEPKKADGQGDFMPYNDYNQGNQYNKPNNGNQYNKSYDRPFNQPNNSPYRGETNYRAPQKQESPFDDISSQFDISSDDLPF